MKVDGSNELQVGVNPPNAVDVSAVLQTGAHRSLVQIIGFAPHPDKQTHQPLVGL